MKINKFKLATILATCMVAAMISRCTNFSIEFYEEHEKNLYAARRQQASVRKYVIDNFRKSENVEDAEARLTNFIFAKMVLNAYDTPYQRVIDALKNHQDDINRNDADKEKPLKSTDQVVVEAYREALKESQKYSVMILTELRRNQEKMPNEKGRQSHSDESFQQWPLRELADFEGYLLNSYLNSALEFEPQTQ